MGRQENPKQDQKRPKCPSKFVKRPWFKPMEGLVLPVTAFMSFASILWLVVAKLADSGENVAVTVHSSSGNIQISAKNITTSATTIEKKRMSRRQRKNVKKRGKDSDN